MEYDFSGWATRNDLRCSDGRTIRRNAFIENDGQTVPLVWNHGHNDAKNVLGHALLENREEGVYTYCKFNNTDAGQNAKECVRNGDITRLSIFANHLRQHGGDVLHGEIREVSLVLAGANPGAFIDTVMEHADMDEEDAYIFTPYEIELAHADAEEDEPEDVSNDEENSGETLKDVFDTLNEKQKKAVYAIIGMATKGKLSHADDTKDAEDTEDDMANNEKTIADIFNTLNEEQKKAVYAMIGMALESKGNGNMAKHNVFDNDDYYTENNTLSHADEEAIFADASRYGSLKESMLAHGIDNIDYLFPDAQNLSKTPEWLKIPDDWVKTVMNGVHRTPFSRVKSMYADITEADARAKGYIKGNRKIEEIFGVLKRTTTPTTIYKKQKLDRDDAIDITDFDVVAWIKTEMRMMLDDEIARAILVGDGRSASSDDKINEQNIRPIWTDDDVYTIKKKIVVSVDATEDDKAKAFIRAVVKSRKDYRGTGNPSLFTTEDVLNRILLMEDTTGRIIYDTIDKVKTALRVANIYTVPVLEGLSRVSGTETLYLQGILVNLADYNVGMDKGGAVSMFDDFDIDYNAQKYLIETRCSGALVRPCSAIVFEETNPIVLTVEPEEGTNTILGKAVSALQDRILVNDKYITGTLKWVTGYTGYSGDPAEQSGNYLALKFDAPSDATTTIELVGSGRAPVELDSDMNAVIRVTNKNTQKLKVTTTVDGNSISQIYSLSSLICNKE